MLAEILIVCSVTTCLFRCFAEEESIRVFLCGRARTFFCFKTRNAFLSLQFAPNTHTHFRLGPIGFRDRRQGLYRVISVFSEVYFFNSVRTRLSRSRLTHDDGALPRDGRRRREANGLPEYYVGRGTQEEDHEKIHGQVEPR